jgi:hypothetical protein
MYIYIEGNGNFCVAYQIFWCKIDGMTVKNSISKLIKKTVAK